MVGRRQSEEKCVTSKDLYKFIKLKIERNAHTESTNYGWEKVMRFFLYSSFDSIISQFNWIKHVSIYLYFSRSIHRFWMNLIRKNEEKKPEKFYRIASTSEKQFFFLFLSRSCGSQRTINKKFFYDIIWP